MGGGGKRGGGSSTYVVGHRYYAGLHLALCHGPVDAVTRIIVGERTAWSGSVTSSQTLYVNAPELFGGDSREGGVQGYVEIKMGGAAETVSGYLQQKLGSVIPAFRGVVSIIAQQCQLSAMNPYIKPWSIEARRIPAPAALGSGYINGDANPAHLDAGFAAHGPFGHVVVHGMWTAALISAVLGTRLPGPGTIYLDQQIRFNKPVSPGDTITAEVEVAELIGVIKVMLDGYTEASLDRVLARGCWTPVERFGESGEWSCGPVDADGACDILLVGMPQGRLNWRLLGEHNRLNALAAIAAARHVGVPPAVAIDALSRFANVKRRMEVKGVAGGVTVYDDFAHHPTAIATTLAGLRAKVGAARILAVLEPRSNTMKLGTMKAELPGSLADADQVFCYGANLGWDAAEALAPLGAQAQTFDQLDALVAAVRQAARAGDHVLVMSNGGFGGVHGKLLAALAN